MKIPKNKSKKKKSNLVLWNSRTSDRSGYSSSSNLRFHGLPLKTLIASRVGGCHGNESSAKRLGEGWRFKG